MSSYVQRLWSDPSRIVSRTVVRLAPAVCIALSGMLIGAPVAADSERLTLEWIFSDEGKSAASVPSHAWLEDGTLVLYDTRPAMSERTLESFDPRNGRRRSLVDAPQVLSKLNELLAPDEPLEELGWPADLDPQGRWAVYEKEKDIVLLDLRSGDLVAPANTEASEKSPRFSPDGRWLAFVRDHDLFVWNLEQRSEKRLTEDGSETLLNGTLSWVYWEEVFNRVDRGYVWSPDSRAIAYLQTDESGLGMMNYVDFEPYLPQLIEQRHPKVGQANPRIRAGVVDLEHGKTTWVDLGAFPYEYLVRVQWLPDGERLAVQTLDRPQTALDVFLVDAGSGRVKHLFRETDEAWINVHDDLYFLGDGEHFVWRSERSGFAHLYLYRMTGELERRITDGDWTLRPSGGPPGLDRAVAHIDERGGWIYFTALEKSSTERQLYRVRLDGSEMRRLSREDGTHRILFRPDGEFYVDAWSALDRPPSLVLHRPSGERQAVLTAAAEGLTRRFDLLPWELFSIPAGDGFRMPAKMLKPRGFDPGTKHPVVIYVYGGPSAPTVTHSWGGRARDYYHRMLADAGFIVLYVDNRSAAAVSKSLTSQVLGSIWGPVELGDLLDGVAWLKGQPYVDAGRVGIWGWSGGGTYTLQAMTGSKEFKAGIAVAAVSDQRYYDTIYTERYMKRPQDNPEGYASVSNADRAKELHGRLMLVHGTYDDNVHPQNTWRFADELIEVAITFDMMVYPMRKHGIKDDEAQLHLYKTMLEFWLRNMDARGGATIAE